MPNKFEHLVIAQVGSVQNLQATAPVQVSTCDRHDVFFAQARLRKNLSRYSAESIARCNRKFARTPSRSLKLE